MKQISSLLAAIVLLLLCGGCGQVIIKAKAKQGDAEALSQFFLFFLDFGLDNPLGEIKNKTNFNKFKR